MINTTSLQNQVWNALMEAETLAQRLNDAANTGKVPAAQATALRDATNLLVAAYHLLEEVGEQNDAEIAAAFERQYQAE